MSCGEALENPDFFNIQGDYVHLFKDAKNYSREILKEIIKMNSSDKFSLESLTELERKLDSLNLDNKDNPYIYRDDEITLEYTIHDMKYFLGKNKKSKENIIAFCQIYLDKINTEERTLLLSADDLLKSLEELNQTKKENPMGKTNKKVNKKNETEVSEGVDNTEALKEETAKAKNTETKGENMKKDNITEAAEKIYQTMSGVLGNDDQETQKTEESETKSTKDESSFFTVGKVLTGVGLLGAIGLGVWAYKHYTGNGSTDSVE